MSFKFTWCDPSTGLDYPWRRETSNQPRVPPEKEASTAHREGPHLKLVIDNTAQPDQAAISR